MKIETKPLSVNACWKGRRFKTDVYKQYELEVLLLANKTKWEKIEGWVEIKYDFYLKNFSKTDTGNLEKPLTDILVKLGLIDDDRFIKKITLEKHQSKTNYIEIIILPIKTNELSKT